MSNLRYLVNEIGYGMEIFYSSRTGGNYLRTAFILCDDYVELLSKLWLLERIRNWNECKQNGNYKNFNEILGDVRTNREGHCSQNAYEQLIKLTNNMKERRKRRNDFFHSTHLLDLDVKKSACVHAFCDLIELGEHLFGNDWEQQIHSTTNFEIYFTFMQLERITFYDSTMGSKINELLQNWPRREQGRTSIPKKGYELAKFPEDMHLRLCIEFGSTGFLDKLKSLLRER